jgi:hypothetical protein
MTPKMATTTATLPTTTEPKKGCLCIYNPCQYESLHIIYFAFSLIIMFKYYLIIYILSVECEYNTWGAWSRCSKKCGGGKKSRTRAEKTPAANGEKLCIVASKKQKKKCNKKACSGL